MDEKNRDSYTRAIEAEVRRQRAKFSFLPYSTEFRSEVIESGAEFTDLAYQAANEGGYSEFYFSGHLGSHDSTVVVGYGPKISYLTGTDIVSFMAIALGQRRVAALFGCRTSSTGLSQQVADGAEMMVLGTDENVEERVFFGNNGYSDQVERIEWAGGGVWSSIPSR